MELINLKDSELDKLLETTECNELIERIKKEIGYRLEYYL